MTITIVIINPRQEMVLECGRRIWKILIHLKSDHGVEKLESDHGVEDLRLDHAGQTIEF